MQSSEVYEFIYHECLIHPALVCHSNPKSVFIMGGGEGSAAREALRHKSLDKVVMCDIDQEVVGICRTHLTANHEAFKNIKLNLVINDTKAELEGRKEKFDIIVGDLVESVEGGPCYQLNTKSFYENILKPKLTSNGIFVTQAGPAGVFTHKEVFSYIHNTIKQVFKYVLAYTAHVPSFADTWGWVMASDQPFYIDVMNLDKRISKRIDGELLYGNGASFVSSTILNKTVAKMNMKDESRVKAGPRSSKYICCNPLNYLLSYKSGSNIPNPITFLQDIEIGTRNGGKPGLIAEMTCLTHQPGRLLWEIRFCLNNLATDFENCNNGQYLAYNCHINGPILLLMTIYTNGANRRTIGVQLIVIILFMTQVKAFF